MLNPIEITMGSEGRLAQVRVVSESGERIHVRFANGTTAWFDSHSGSFEASQVLLLCQNGDQSTVDHVPQEAWVEPIYVGVVKFIFDDLTIVDSGVRWIAINTVDNPQYEVGNSVLYGEVRGVVRVISETPTKFIDLSPITDDTISSFLWKPNEKEGLDYGDFGGLTDVVARAKELIEIPLKKRTLWNSLNAKPIKGILFTGLPGTGKTMLARIIASQTDSAFFKISGPEIFSKWYGQTEELLRRLFDAASNKSSSIIFFDEIDTIAAQRGNSSHEASKRVVGQLLTLMDGFKPDANVVVIAATNRPQDLDAAIRRPGRFDWEIEFPLPDREDRREVLEKSSIHIPVEGSIPFALVAQWTEGWSAAELTAIWTQAALCATADDRNAISAEDVIVGYERIAGNRRNLEGLGATSGDK